MPAMEARSRRLNADAFKGQFSFDEFLETLAEGIIPSPATDDAAAAAAGVDEKRTGGGLEDCDSVGPQFPEALKLSPLFKNARGALVDLCYQVDARLDRLRKQVATYENEHTQKFAQLERGVESLAASFDRLDARVTTVGQTAAKIGDHLESSDSQRNTANQAIDLVKYMMYFNEGGGFLVEQPSLFSDDDRVAEAAAVAQTLRAIAEDNTVGVQAKNTANGTGTLDVAVKNLQAYCNELENCLLAQFDAALQKGDLSTMADCAKILSKFNRGTGVMQRYIASRPMFMDLDVMNMDARTVLGAEGGLVPIDDIMKGLTSVYKDITESVRKEADIVAAVFPSPAAVMSILIQRVLEQRVNALLDKLLSKPPLTSPTPMEQGGLKHFLRILAGAYGKTKELANELQAFGCGDLNVEALAESLFKSHREDYSEIELTSLNQLHNAKVTELKSAPPLAELAATAPQRRNSAMHIYAPISVSVVEEFLHWNDEAVARCKLLTPQVQPGLLATNVRAIFTCLLDQMSQYITEGLNRAMEALKDAAALRERFGYNTTNNRRVAAAVAAAAEAATAAGESSFRAFMVAIQSATTNVAMVQRYFGKSISRVLLSQEGAHAACCEAIASAMATAEGAALMGLQSAINGLVAEVERLLVAEQRVTDYKLPENENVPHYPTVACSSVIVFLTRMLEVACGALDGSNKQAFLTELGTQLYKVLIQHWRRFTFNASGGLRLKRDVSEYADFVRSFKATTVDENFGLLCTLVNVFIVAPENLPTLVDGTLSTAKEEAIRFIELREDYKKAKIAAMFSAATKN